jgi:predicted transcriptional regulator
MTDFKNRIIEILRNCPSGLTTKDIAERLGTTAGNVSSPLSKMAAYGIIGKLQGTVASHGTKAAVYLPPAQPRVVGQAGLRTSVRSA